MEKINIYKQAPELIDGLLEIVNSAQKMLLKIKYLECVNKPTKLQLNFMNFFNISYRETTSREEADRLIKLKGRQLLNSLKKIHANDSKRGKNDDH